MGNPKICFKSEKENIKIRKIFFKQFMKPKMLLQISIKVLDHKYFFTNLKLV